MADTFVWEMHQVRKGLWALFSWLCFTCADWLGRQTPITWMKQSANFSNCPYFVSVRTEVKSGYSRVWSRGSMASDFLRMPKFPHAHATVLGTSYIWKKEEDRTGLKGWRTSKYILVTKWSEHIVFHSPAKKEKKKTTSLRTDLRSFNTAKGDGGSAGGGWMKL